MSDITAEEIADELRAKGIVGYEVALARKDQRIAELEAALREIADGHIDPLGNRRNHFRATSIAREALGIADR